MELTPREIQDRLRAGASVEDVAAAAGVEAEEIASFSDPIIAEREHISALARGCHVRRAGDSPTHPGLEEVVTEELTARQVDPSTVSWDATRVEPRRWQVSATVSDGSRERVGLFNFDVMGRFSVGANDDARWMLGETPLPPVDTEAEPTIKITEEQRRANLEAQDRLAESLEEGWDDADDDTFDDDLDDDSGLSVLYDMMAGYEETVAGYEDTLSVLHDRDDLRGDPWDGDDRDSDARDGGAGGNRRQRGEDPQRPARRTSGTNRRATARPAEPDQPSLVEDGKDHPRTRRSSRSRARVPSWDEIMFGNGDTPPRQ